MKASTLKISNVKILSILALLLVWKGLSLYIDMEIILPSPEQAFLTLFSMMSEAQFWNKVFSTVIRSLKVFLISSILAMVLGILSSLIEHVNNIISPIINILKATPTISVILLALIWLGTKKSPMLVGFMIIFPLLYTNVIEGFKNIDYKLVEMAKMYKVSKIKIIKDIYIPSISSYIVAGMSTALGLNVKVIIAAEVLSQTQNSIGEGLYLQKAYLNTSGVFAWTIVAILISAIFEWSLRYIQRGVEKWRKTDIQ